MDPNLFHLDWDRTAEVLATIVILAFMLERALSVLFEHRAFVGRFDRRGYREPLAFLVASFICVRWQFDALSMIVLRDQVSVAGEILTAAVITGTSKGAVKLFRDVMGVQSRAAAHKADRSKRGPGPAPSSAIGANE